MVSGFTPVDLVTLLLTALCVFFIAWLTNKEIRKSVTHRHVSEKSLEEERDLLERKVSERTRELMASRQARIEENARLVKFGELSEGLFHDLINPLNTVSLYIERLSDRRADPKEAREIVQKTVEASKRMGSFMESVKSIIGTAKEGDNADLAHELDTVLDLVAYKARMAGVRMVAAKKDPVHLHIHPVRIQQLLLNIISNAIEACEKVPEEDRPQGKTVQISISEQKGRAEIKVVDNGCGIGEKYSNDILKKPFTTKTGGSGIGLMTVKSIVENELGGTVEISDTGKTGTVCLVKIPLKN